MSNPLSSVVRESEREDVVAVRELMYDLRPGMAVAVESQQFNGILEVVAIERLRGRKGHCEVTARELDSDKVHIYSWRSMLDSHGGTLRSFRVASAREVYQAALTRSLDGLLDAAPSESSDSLVAELLAACDAPSAE